MKNDIINVLYTVSLFALTLLVGFLLGGLVEESKHQTKAIKAGVGHWTVNPTNGNTTFIYEKGQL